MENIIPIFVAYSIIKYFSFVTLISKNLDKGIIEIFITFLSVPIVYYYTHDLLFTIFIIETELILSNVLLIINVTALKNFGFKMIVSVTHNGLFAKMFCKIFNKKRICQVAKRLQQIEYGPKLKHGIPAMAGKTHKETKVKFDRLGFPKFRSYYTIHLRIKDYKKSRDSHFNYANKKLYEKALRLKKVRKLFTKNDLEELKKGNTPDKYTWHHHQNRGKMQLVSRKIHENVYHIGGYSIWGGGR